MKFNRREVLKGGLSALGFLALPGGLFAAPVGWKPKKKPNLVFGVVSDTHMRCHYDGKRFYSRYDDVWHKTVKGYHFFGFGWPMWPEEGLDPALPYKGWLYHDTPDEGKGRDAYIHAERSSA